MAILVKKEYDIPDLYGKMVVRCGQFGPDAEEVDDNLWEIVSIEDPAIDGGERVVMLENKTALKLGRNVHLPVLWNVFVRYYKLVNND